jgi:hypothetical protein
MHRGCQLSLIKDDVRLYTDILIIGACVRQSERAGSREQGDESEGVDWADWGNSRWALHRATTGRVTSRQRWKPPSSMIDKPGLWVCGTNTFYGVVDLRRERTEKKVDMKR